MRTPLDINLVDNRKFDFVSDEGRSYVEDSVTKDRLCVGIYSGSGRNSHARWDRRDCWDSIADLVRGLINDSNKGVVHILSSDGYSHDTDDVFVEVLGNGKGGFSLQTGNLVGSISNTGPTAGDAVGRVSIGSRFGNVFLKYIIADADGFLSLRDAGGSESTTGGYDWLLGYLWNTKLKSAYRLGIPKCYVDRQDVLVGPRGQIDVVDCYGYEKKGRARCSFREQSYDSPAASLFEEAWRVLNRRKSTRPFTFQTSRIVQDFMRATGGRHRKRNELLHVKPFMNAFYSEYNRLIELSKDVVRHFGSDVSYEHRSDAILFDISMLFEYYLRKLLKRNGFHVVNKEVEHLKIPTCPLCGEYARKLIPDLVIESPAGINVFDVKYKSFDPRYGVSRDDVFQLHTYIGQYGNTREIKACGFLYPISETRWKIFRRGADCERVVLPSDFEQQGKRISFCVGFLVVPDSAVLINGEKSECDIMEFRRRLSPWLERLLDQLKDFVE